MWNIRGLVIDFFLKILLPSFLSKLLSKRVQSETAASYAALVCSLEASTCSRNKGASARTLLNLYQWNSFLISFETCHLKINMNLAAHLHWQTYRLLSYTNPAVLSFMFTVHYCFRCLDGEGLIFTLASATCDKGFIHSVVQCHHRVSPITQPNIKDSFTFDQHQRYVCCNKFVFF